MRKPMLAAFDFDKTLVDGDCLQTMMEIGVGHSLPDVKAAYTFSSDALATTQAMVRDMQRTRGVTAQDIRRAVQEIPLTAGMGEVLQLLKARGCDVIIISDMTTIAIDDWMSASPLASLVDKVYTNPAHYDQEGYMVIEPYHRQDWCALSFKHLCKGHVLEEHVKSRVAEGVTYDRVVFFGDGRNDLCPVLRLREQDLAFPRQGFKLMEMLGTPDGAKVKAAVHPWSCGEDIIPVLEKFLDPQV